MDDQIVTAPCGCRLECNWAKGERGVWCGCGRQWNVSRTEETVVTYTVGKESTPTGG